VAEQRELILDQFTRQAEPFATAPSIRDEGALRLVVEDTGAGPADDVLDVACGPGLLACAFAQVARSATGIDLVPAMIEQARHRQAELDLTNVTWRVGDINPLPWPDGSFDVVTCRYAFHHFVDPGAVLTEMVRVCRQGGRVCVIDVTASPDPAKAAAFDRMETWRDPSHVRALPHAELLGLLQRAGLPSPRETSYLLETELEAVLSRSFPEPGDAEKVREAVTGTLDDDRLGVPARRRGERVVFAYPVTVFTAVRA
jgi:ubiquinone/menaquinone biosynthesis C-methylase UbiE